MSDNSGSSGSSSNSWTMLTPEEAAVESIGPVDEETESLGDVASLSEEATGGAVESKIDTVTPIEAMLSEEGQQVCPTKHHPINYLPVCQETAPDISEGPAQSSPTLLSPSPTSHEPIALDLESQPPVIFDIVTSSPTDSDLAAMPFNYEVDLGPPSNEGQPPSPSSRSATHEGLPHGVISDDDTSPSPEIPPIESSALDAHTHLSPSLESQPIESYVPVVNEELSPAADSQPIDGSVTDFQADLSSYTASDLPPLFNANIDISPSESPAPSSHIPESIGSVETEEEPQLEGENPNLAEKLVDLKQEAASGSGSDGGGVRWRNVAPAQPLRRRPDEEEEEEEEEFQFAERAEEKRGFSLNACIIAALLLLTLGSLFLSGTIIGLDSDDWDSTELSDQDLQNSQDILEKLAQENHHITQIETQLQSQKEELDQALNRATENGGKEEEGYHEKENVKLREELASLPGLKEELESLRARVIQLTQLTANQEVTPPPSTLTPPPSGLPKSNQTPPAVQDPEEDQKAEDGHGRLMEELQRQRDLLEESRERLMGMKKGGGGGQKKGVRENLVELERRLSDQVEKLSKRKHWQNDANWDGQKAKENKVKWDSKKGKDNKAKWDTKKEDNKAKRDTKKDHEKEDKWDTKKEDNKAKWGTKKDHEKEDKWDTKKGKENGKEHRMKEENKKEWNHGKDERGEVRREDRKAGDRKAHKQNSHKDAWRKYQDEWDGRKDERKTDREKRKSERPWQIGNDKKCSHHHDQHQNPNGHYDFWKHQEEKLKRNVRPLVGCSSIEDCAKMEGLVPVELAEFEQLLEGYLSKLDGTASESKDKIRKLATKYFDGGLFAHNRLRFSDFIEDVADILEDMADILEEQVEDGDSHDLEEEMEEFEREALWKFADTV